MPKARCSTSTSSGPNGDADINSSAWTNGYRLISAEGINDAGQIIAIGQKLVNGQPTGEHRAFLLQAVLPIALIADTADISRPGSLDNLNLLSNDAGGRRGGTARGVVVVGRIPDSSTGH